MTEGGGLTEEFDEYRRRQAEKWLEHVRGLRLRRDAMQAAIDGQRALMDGLKGIDYAFGGGSCAPSPDAVPNTVIRIQGMVAEYCAALAEYVDEQDRARKALARLERAEHCQALTLRYVEGWEWERVCVEMKYSYHGMMKLARAATCAAYGVMPPEWRDPMHPAL